MCDSLPSSTFCTLCESMCILNSASWIHIEWQIPIVVKVPICQGCGSFYMNSIHGSQTMKVVIMLSLRSAAQNELTKNGLAVARVSNSCTPCSNEYLIVTGFHYVHGNGMSFCNSADRYVSVAAGTRRECRPLSGLYENKKCMLAPSIFLSIILTCPPNVSNLKCVITTEDSRV